MWLSYSYTNVGGFTVTYANQLMGAATTFTCLLLNQYSVGGVVKYQGWKLKAVVLPKLSFALKNADYQSQDLDFTCYADVNGGVLEYYTSE